MQKPAMKVPFDWGRVIVDELHLEINKTTRIISLVRATNKQIDEFSSRKIFSTGTPFERESGQIANWMALLENNLFN